MAKTPTPPKPGSESNAFSKTFLLRLSLISLLLLTAMLGAFSYYAFSDFEEMLAPEVNQKAQLVGENVSRSIEAATRNGIPIENLTGMGLFLDNLRQGNPDIAAIHIVINGSNDDRVLFLSPQDRTGWEQVSDAFERIPIPFAGQGVTAEVRVYTTPGYWAGQIRELRLDIITAVLIALLATFEMLSFFVRGRIFGPMGAIDEVLSKGKVGDFSRSIHNRAILEVQHLELKINQCLYKISERSWDLLEEFRELRAAQINQEIVNRIDRLVGGFAEKVKTGEPYAFADLRIANIPAIRFSLFLFMFAEELSRPILPLLTKDFVGVGWMGMPPDFAAGIPIALFMAIVAIASLSLGNLVEHIGVRNMFLLGIVPTVIGFLGVYWAWDYISFLISRGITALGYAMVFMACQGYVMAYSKPDTRATNMGDFVGAILVAGICGPAIGGILASRIGYMPTFLWSAGFALCSALVLALILGKTPDAENTETTRLSKEDRQIQRRRAFKLFGDRRFIALAIFCAIPAKMMLTGVLFLMVPLYLVDIDVGESAIGRVLMLYGVGVVVLMPLAARYADRMKMHANMVVLGGIISGLGGVLLLGWGGLWAVTVMAISVGVGQALSISQQLALVQSIIRDNPNAVSLNAGMGIFRSVERLGNVAGPLVIGGLVIFMSYETAAAILAIASIVGAVAFWLLDRSASEPSGEVVEAGADHVTEK